MPHMFIAIGIILCHARINAYENIAIGKPTHQSSTYKAEWGSEKAVDGDRSPYSQSNKCAIGSIHDKSGFWYVDMEQELGIYHITIFYRTENVPGQPLDDWDAWYRGRFAGFFLYISNDTNRENGHLCYHEIQNGPNSPPPIMTIECVVRGRYVIYYNERRADYTYPEYYSTNAYIDLCEVEVLGCPGRNQYGEDCMSCPSTCKDQHCNITNGACFACPTGFTGDLCNKTCSFGTYGDKCEMSCGSCKGGKSCNHINGSCQDGCAGGWYGEKCIFACPPGFYGFHCNDTCSSSCGQSGQCDRYTGKCIGGCQRGFQGDKCESNCDAGTYGLACNKLCGHCFHGNYCQHVNGSCLNGCNPGYKGDLCEEKCDVGNNCIIPVFHSTECDVGTFGQDCIKKCGFCKTFQMCHHVTGVCKDGCKNGFTGDYCDEVAKFLVAKTSESEVISYSVNGVLAIIVIIHSICLGIICLRGRSNTPDSTFDKEQGNSTPTLFDNKCFYENDEGDQSVAVISDHQYQELTQIK